MWPRSRDRFSCPLARVCSVISIRTYHDDRLSTFAGCTCAAPEPGKCYNALGQGQEAAMRAVWYDRQGAADEVLVCGELPTPEVGHSEVRVRLEASGVNPSDTYRPGHGIPSGRDQQ